MKIDVNKEEITAILFAIDFAKNDCSAEAQAHFVRLLDVRSKCEREMAREQMREQLRKEAKTINPGKKPREIEALVNRAMKLIDP